MSRAAIELRRLGASDMEAAAAVMRASFDERLPSLTGLHTPAQDVAFFRDHLLPDHSIWGAFDGSKMIGAVAFKEGWLDQLYVLPSHQGLGAGGALLEVARAGAAELSLRTFQRNVAARRFYERHSFVVVAESDGSTNEEREPDVLYRWAAK